ncbi:carbohydrate ABC transporter permease, partial [Clostridium perfringens]
LQNSNSSLNSGNDYASQFASSESGANQVTPTSIRATMTIVASVPIILVYPFLQKYFVQGMTLGGVKG